MLVGHLISFLSCLESVSCKHPLLDTIVANSRQSFLSTT